MSEQFIFIKTSKIPFFVKKKGICIKCGSVINNLGLEYCGKCEEIKNRFYFWREK